MEAVKIIGERGFRATRNIRQCQRCKKVIKEVFDPETSRWVCPVCGAPTPKRKVKKIKDKEEYKKEKEREYRKKYPVPLRKSDHKVGTSRLGSHRHDDTKKEQKEIDKEYKKLKMADGPRLQRIMECGKVNNEKGKMFSSAK